MIFPFVETLQNPLGTKERTSIHSPRALYRALGRRSLTAESRRPLRVFNGVLSLHSIANSCILGVGKVLYQSGSRIG